MLFHLSFIFFICIITKVNNNMVSKNKFIFKQNKQKPKSFQF